MESNILMEKLANKDLIYSEIIAEIKTAQELLNEVKMLSSGLQDLVENLRRRSEGEHLKYEDLPDYLIIKELKTWLRFGSNKVYELVNTPGFPTIRAGNKMIFAKAQVREYMERSSSKE
jgi:hypothetical protein